MVSASFIFDETDEFRTLVDIISDIAEMAKFRVENDSLFIKCINEANTLYTDIEIKEDIFSEITGNSVFCLQIEEFAEAVKTVSERETLKAQVKDNEVELIVEGSSKRKYSLDIDDYPPELPQEDSSYDSKIVLETSKLNGLMEKIGFIGEDVIIEVDDNNIELRSSSDTSDASIEVENDELDNLVVQENSQGRYKKSYIKKFENMEKISDQVVLELSDNSPLIMTYDDDKFSVEVTIALRIEEN